MNYALSQPRTDRHPVGLMVVVGLHVVLAAALISAKLTTQRTEAAPVPLIPIEPSKTVVPKTSDLPQPATHALRPLVVPIPIVDPDHTDALPVVKHDDRPVDKPEPTLIAMLDKPHDPVRVTPHNGVLNAGASQCRPDYPAAAQRAGATGVSRIRFSVDAAGRILGAQILQSSGTSRENRMMDQAAATALAKCPVTLGTDDQGRAVPFTTDVDYVWALN